MDFQKDVIESAKPVVVRFTAPWCGPCRQMGPIVAQLSKEMAGVTFLDVDVDADEATPARLGVVGVPTFMTFKDGKNVATIVGAKPLGMLREWVAESIR